MGRANLGAGGSPDRAIASFNEAMRMDPDNLEVQNELGRLYLLRGDLANALRICGWRARPAAIVKMPSWRWWSIIAWCVRFQQGGYDRAALEVYEKLLKRFERPGFSLRGNPDLAYLVNRPELLYVDIGQLYEKHQ